MEERCIDLKQDRYLPSIFIVVPIAILLVFALVKPVPLVGGITDDFKYLTGAQCLDCLPINHWERRFAIVWPTGIAIRLFGQNLWSVMIFPLAAAITALVLLFMLVQRQYGRVPAILASSVLALTPIFSERATRIGIDIIELAFLLGSILLLQSRKGHFWAGTLMGLAILCRPTQLAALPMVAFLAWWQDPKALKWFAFGVAAPVLAEALVYWIAAGDPLYSWKLSLNHVHTPQPFLSPDVDRTQSPLFNPSYIGGWLPIAGIKAHWTVQGIINLMQSEVAATLWAGVLCCLLARKELDRLQWALIGSAVLFFGALTYGFAVDPRPRMFLPILAISATLAGSLVPKLWSWPKFLILIPWVPLILLFAIQGVRQRNDYRPDALIADKMIAERPYLVTSVARQRLALIRQEFPSGGDDLLHIDRNCPTHPQDRRLIRRVGNVCIYRH